MDEVCLRYPLKLKNYNDLRPAAEDLIVPRLLVVVVVPADVGGWLQQSEEELALRHCGYWLSIQGAAPTENQETVTVVVPRIQQFTPTALQRIMQRVNGGGAP